MKGIFFVVTKYINSEDNLTDHQIRGNVQKSNGNRIPFLFPSLSERLSQDNLEYELERSKKDLEAIVGGEIIFFAPPGGWFNQRVLSAAKKQDIKRFSVARSGEPTSSQSPFFSGGLKSSVK